MSDLFTDLPIVDHHCHGVLRRDVDRPDFEGMLTEADEGGPWQESLLDSQIGFALRRWCAPVLDLEPLAPAPDYLARRSALGHEEVSRRLLRAAGTATYVVDTGYVPEPITDPSELAAFTDGAGHEIVRLEQVAEQVIRAGTTAAGFTEALREALSVRTASAVGVKSIAAYRAGLELPGLRPTDGEVAGVAGRWLREIDGGAPARCNDAVLHAFLVWTAIDLGKPIQFHVGLGDKDTDLARGNPLLLTDLLRSTEAASVPITLLHNYPYQRYAGYLAQVFGHVFVDVGLATHNLGRGAGRIVAELLELAPFGKVLFSSDAFGLAELYHLGTHLFTQALDRLLTSGVVDGDWAEADARRIAAMIMGGNATRVYGLDRR